MSYAQAVWAWEGQGRECAAGQKTTTSYCLTLSFEIYDRRAHNTSKKCREQVQEMQERETAVGRKTKVITAAIAIIAILQYCGPGLSRLVLPQYGRATAGARTINFSNNYQGLPIVPSHVEVVCRGEMKEHGGEKDHPMVIQHCFWRCGRPYAHTPHLRSNIFLAARHRQPQGDHPDAIPQPELGLEAENERPQGGFSG